ncbi:uncharacterized protein LOC115229060 [Octopus sinensis]|uniref:Uncharacterized protein LOC115229060 n=1 Tax=Octopus sinensis TaxID=2607531 RepID=A0A6P7TZI8_9MOLL|nr:uncharacterized protein LOC115229060 [Octopus sinensis]
MNLKNLKTTYFCFSAGLARTKLNSVNLFKTINEYALSLYNYYIGLINIEPFEFDDIDLQIRRLLTTLKIHLKPANKERLYLSRKSMGRGLTSIAFKSELMLLHFLETLEKKSAICLRRSGILRVIKKEKPHMATIAGFLASKYGLTDKQSITDKSLKEAYVQYFSNKIKNKSLHSVLFRFKEDSNSDLKMSSEWLYKGNNTLRSEALYCLLQDINLFFSSARGALCDHCKKAKKTVDHMATRCNRMLNSDYVRRHNEVFRCIHLHVCRQFGIKKTGKLKSHSVQSSLSARNVEIRVDTPILTDTQVQFNKPDIFIYDRLKNEITIIEMEITSQERLKQTEVEKLHKYDLLAGELKMLYGAPVRIIPIVLTWDGVVSTCYKAYMEKLSVEGPTRTYIQGLVMKKTLEAIVVEHRHGIHTSQEEFITATSQLAEVANQSCEDPSDEANGKILCSENESFPQRIVSKALDISIPTIFSNLRYVAQRHLCPQTVSVVDLTP